MLVFSICGFCIFIALSPFGNASFIDGKYKFWTDIGIYPHLAVLHSEIVMSKISCLGKCTRLGQSCMAAAYNEISGKCEYRYLSNPSIDIGNVTGVDLYIKMDWIMVLRCTSGTGDKVYEVWRDRTDGVNKDDTHLRTLNPEVQGLFLANALANLWPYFSKAKVAMALGGKEQIFMTFDTLNTTYMDWFNQSRILDSSYTDYSTAPSFPSFRIEGDVHNLFERRFLAFTHYEGCSGDRGWFEVIDADPNNRLCSWERIGKMRSFPMFLFANATVGAHLPTYATFADVFAIYISL